MVEAASRGTGVTSRPTPFTYTSKVNFDELDALGILRSSRYSVHVERATAAFLEYRGFRWDAARTLNPDWYHTTCHFEICVDEPFTGPGCLAVTLRLARIGETTCRYDYTCSGEDGTLYAHGSRTVARLDRHTLRRTAWTERWIEVHRSGLAASDWLSGPPPRPQR